MHSLFPANDPQGWDNQLDNEPVLNFFFMKKNKLWNTASFDGSLGGDIAVGNYHTGVRAGIEMRFGRKPDGFAKVYEPLGQGMFYDATLARDDGATEIYMTLAARAWAWAVFMPLEGNTLVNGNEWTRNNTINPEKVVGQVVTGFHYVRPSWGLHISLSFDTGTVDPDSVRAGTDADNRFGTVSLEWRF